MIHVSVFAKLSQSIKSDMTIRFNQEVADIVWQHLLSATVVSAAALMPGAGPTIAVVGQTGVVYAMYARMSKALGVRFSENALKTIASAVVSNIAANAASVLATLAASTLLSFIPVVGTSAAGVLTTAIAFATVYVSALSYGSILQAIGRKHVDDMSAKELRQLVKEEMAQRDISGEMKEMIDLYRKAGKASA